MLPRVWLSLALFVCASLRLEAELLPKLTLSNSTSVIGMSPFNAELYPVFKDAVSAADSGLAVVITNNSDKKIVVCNIRWVYSVAGRTKQTALAIDSFLTPKAQPLLAPRQRAVATPFAFTSEALVSGGQIKGRSPANGGLMTTSPEVLVTLDLVIFDDGEVVGPDEQHYVADLQGRTLAAKYISEQVSAALARGENSASLLSPLASSIPLADDHVGVWKKQFARELLTSPIRERYLQYLQSLPTLPPFYRRQP